MKNTISQSALLFYCQHSLGMGHLVRSLALAEALAESFRVVLLNGGRLPDCVTAPARVEIVDLPALGLDLEMQLVSHDAGTLEDVQQRRKKMILDTFNALQPDVLLIELFPFGRKKFAGELLPLLDAARALPSPPLTACSLRDILVSRAQSQDNKSAERCNEYFDAVLVHSDPAFARIEESFHARTALHTPVYYTGYVTAAQQTPPISQYRRKRRVVVSVGGGLVGEPLLRAAMEAFPALHETEGIEMKVIGGPFFPDATWQELCARSSGIDGLLLERSVQNLQDELCEAAASISQCGYNTALDLLQTQTPALVIPFDEGRESEQMNRARRLERMGALRVLDPRDLTPARLAEEVRKLLAFKPSTAEINLQGTTRTTAILQQLLCEKNLSETGAYVGNASA